MTFRKVRRPTNGSDTVLKAKAQGGFVKLADVRAGDTLSCEGTIAIEPLPLPEPLYPVAIEAVSKKEEDKLGKAQGGFVSSMRTVTSSAMRKRPWLFGCGK